MEKQRQNTYYCLIKDKSNKEDNYFCESFVEAIKN